MGDCVRFENRGRVLILTPNRPEKLNALECCRGLLSSTLYVFDQALSHIANNGIF